MACSGKLHSPGVCNLDGSVGEYGSIVWSTVYSVKPEGCITDVKLSPVSLFLIFLSISIDPIPV